MRRWEPLLLVGGCLLLLAVTCGLVAGVGLLGLAIFGPSEVLDRLPGRAVNRLVVQGEDDNIYTVRPDGRDQVALTADADEVRRYRQPAWSPRADYVAWAEISPGEEALGAVLISRPDGRDRVRVETETPPFYIAWSPNGRRLVFLRSRISHIALEMVDITASRPEATLLDEGRPYYLDWAPGGERLFAHVDGVELVLLELNGQRRLLDVLPANFPAPQWMPDGTGLVYALRERGEQRLVIADLEGQVRQTVTSFDGRLSFAVSPDGQRVAYVVSPEPVGTAAFGALHVADLDTGEERQISAGPVLAFFWSPDSRRLLFAQLDASIRERPDSQIAQQGPIWFRWRVWDGQRILSFGRFAPTETFLGEYLLFFDQYARSMTLWSPDGTAFVYAGVHPNGESGIWVQPVEERTPPTFVMPGLFAAWSPR